MEIDDETARLVVACISDKEFFHGFGNVYRSIYYVYIVYVSRFFALIKIKAGQRELESLFQSITGNPERLI